MKKALIFILALGLLAGCSSSNAASSLTQKKQETPTKAAQKTVENPQPQKDKDGNIVLTNVGQTLKTDFGTLELAKIKHVNQALSIAPINVTIEDLKVFKLTNISDDMKKRIQLLYNKQEVTEPVYYLQLSYSAENTSEKNIVWNGIHAVVTDKGEQLDPNINLLTSNFNHEFYGKVTQKDQFGLLLSSDKWDISNVKLIFNESADATSYATITPEQQVDYSF
jgi:hypothetical protein